VTLTRAVIADREMLRITQTYWKKLKNPVQWSAWQGGTPEAQSGRGVIRRYGGKGVRHQSFNAVDRLAQHR
jgi:hypothetical protein